jgi:putative tryptophan/tyrosine transport system substrate-binding protein
MRRRQFLTTVGASAIIMVLRSHASAQAKQIRIGFLATAVPTTAMLRAFRDALREHGYVEGQNLSITDRWPQGPSDISDIAAEFVRSNVDIIVAWTTPAALAAKAATATIPIVMVGVGDPVGTGLVLSLARPGGNITGFCNLAPDLSAKQVQLLVEVMPEIRRVGIVRNPSNPAVTVALREVENAIRVLGLESHTVDARLPQEFESAFARLGAEGVKGVIVVADASVIEHRLPTMFQRRENVAAGGLMSYGPDLPDQLRQAAFYVDRILKGTKPVDLPVQQATKIELVINLNTAKALGLTIPPTLLGLADEVIE